MELQHISRFDVLIDCESKLVRDYIESLEREVERQRQLKEYYHNECNIRKKSRRKRLLYKKEMNRLRRKLTRIYEFVGETWKDNPRVLEIFKEL